jgi:hypothetical protein
MSELASAKPDRVSEVRLHSAPLLLRVICGICVLAAVGTEFLPGAVPGLGLSQTLLLLGAITTLWLAPEKVVVPSDLMVGQGTLGVTGVSSARAIRFLWIVVQLILVLLVIRLFRIESPAFYEKIAYLTAAGFVLHAVLPKHRRLAFFVVLSLVGIQLVFGLQGALWLVILGLGLIGLCHLPVRFAIRVALIVAFAGLLALARAELIASPIPGAIWPILGSMFMFRTIIYLYDRKHSKEPVDWRRTFAYFFMLPNVVFPLFPVVDWSMFKRTWYDRDSLEIYQRGVDWIARGVSHLLIYRLVYQFVVISPSAVVDAASLTRFLIGNYLLYLRVSGQFHLIVGMLHLFGFRLPETHRFFFLASSFTDFWRRINIYWKDFMMKIVYYPAFFRLRRLGTTPAVILSTIAVFFGTWLLHAYQWFWLLGGVLLTWPDMLFWGLLGVLLVANTMVEMRAGRARSLQTTTWTARSLAIRSVKTVVFFATMSVLWSLWSAESVSEWLLLWTR